MYTFCTKSNKMCFFQIKRKFKTVMRGNEGHAVRANISLDVSNVMIKN